MEIPTFEQLIYTCDSQNSAMLAAAEPNAQQELCLTRPLMGAQRPLRCGDDLVMRIVGQRLEHC